MLERRLRSIADIGKNALGFAAGIAVLTLAVMLASQVVPPPPANDACEAAILIAVPSVTIGSTASATFGACEELIAPRSDDDDDDGDAPGVWYRIRGTGREIMASTCSSKTDYDTQLSVMRAPCCGRFITSSDDNCQYQSVLIWQSIEGDEYLLRVFGYDETGTFELTVSEVSGPRFRRGDLDGDGRISLTDGIRILRFLFQRSSDVACLDGADTDDSGDMTPTDAIGLFLYLFSSGVEPSYPFSECGPDSEGDRLDCGVPPPCPPAR